MTSNVSRVPMSDLTHGLKPFLWAHGMVLLVLTFVPALSLGSACMGVPIVAVMGFINVTQI